MPYLLLVLVPLVAACGTISETSPDASPIEEFGQQPRLERRSFNHNDLRNIDLNMYLKEPKTFLEFSHEDAFISLRDLQHTAIHETTPFILFSVPIAHEENFMVLFTGLVEIFRDDEHSTSAVFVLLQKQEHYVSGAIAVENTNFESNMRALLQAAELNVSTSVTHVGSILLILEETLQDAPTSVTRLVIGSNPLF